MRKTQNSLILSSKCVEAIDTILNKLFSNFKKNVYGKYFA